MRLGMSITVKPSEQAAEGDFEQPQRAAEARLRLRRSRNLSESSDFYDDSGRSREPRTLRLRRRDRIDASRCLRAETPVAPPSLAAPLRRSAARRTQVRAVPGQNLHVVAAFAAKDEGCPRIRIGGRNPRHVRRQPVEAAPAGRP